MSRTEQLAVEILSEYDNQELHILCVLKVVLSLPFFKLVHVGLSCVFLRVGEFYEDNAHIQWETECISAVYGALCKSEILCEH